MIGWILLASTAGGVLLTWLRLVSGSARWLLNVLAVFAYLLFFAEAANGVLRTLLDGTVFMTQIHEVLLSPLFLISGGYLGPYGLSLLMVEVWTGDKSR